MALASGTRLGPYEILSPLGAGGMGEVYKARDTRLGRDVAVKVLPETFARDAERLARFEREARSASALSDPHIVTVFDVGQEEGIHFIATEFVDGADLRHHLGSGAIPLKKTLDFAEQIASGLAAAHERGIVHRDLKPENILITKSGIAKIADFGLAKQVGASGPEMSQAATAEMHETGTGTIVGTVAYMSPEQAKGGRVDLRSDQFSFGLIFYEMIAGRQAFKRGSPPETLSAIIREEPEPIERINPDVPPNLKWIVGRCLEKDPGDRYDSTRDLARDLRQFREGASSSSGSHRPEAATRKKHSIRNLVAAALLGAAAVAGFFLLLSRGRTELPVFRRLTFRRGRILNARFGPDGRTLVYSAAWEGKPQEIYLGRTDDSGARPLGIPDADLLSVSSNGDLAILVKTIYQSSGGKRGTLARVPMSGGAPREIADGVLDADWSPDGRDLAILRVVNGRGRVEYPIGKVIAEGLPWAFFNVRVAPGGDLIAYWEFDEKGALLTVVDRKGSRRVLYGPVDGKSPIAWTADRRLLLQDPAADDLPLITVDLRGRKRILSRPPVLLVPLDVARDGRVLVQRNVSRHGILYGRGESPERDLSWLDGSTPAELSHDGRTLIFAETGDAAGATPLIFMRGTDGSPAVQLGEGYPIALTGDGKQVLGQKSGSTPDFILVPTGAGTVTTVKTGDVVPAWGGLGPGDRSIVFAGRAPGHALRGYIVGIEGGQPRAFTPEGVTGLGYVSPDGKWVPVAIAQGPRTLYPLGGGTPRILPGLEPMDSILQWSDDGGSLYVSHRSSPPLRIFRYDLALGTKKPWRELEPADMSGVSDLELPFISPDGKSYAYGYSRVVADDLYLADGLK